MEEWDGGGKGHVRFKRKQEGICCSGGVIGPQFVWFHLKQ